MLVAPHPEHDAMFNVEQDLFLLSVVSDEGMQGVTVGHPANQARVGGQGDDCVALNANQCNTNTVANECYCFILLPCSPLLEYISVRVCVPDVCEM